MTPIPSGPNPSPRIVTVARAARELGPGSLALYALYLAMLHSGWLRRRTPVYAWDERPLAHWMRPGLPTEPAAYLAYRLAPSFPARFLFEPLADLSTSLAKCMGHHRSHLLEEANAILHGRFRLFGGAVVALGFPPPWLAFAPLGEIAAPIDVTAERHWTTYPPDSFPADVKLLWEASRFTWVYPLVRAYRLTGDERFAHACLHLVNSWRAANPPNRGPHWFSGQEVALRVQALCFAWYGLAAHLRDAPEQAATIAHMIAVHADRLPATLIYARSLANNHLVSEAAGLYTAGLLFPEFRSAPRWRGLGRRWLTRSLISQVLADGGHVQHSINYHRFVLQAGLWAARLAERNNDPLPHPARTALQRMAAFERSLVDPETGRVPNFGPNDGAELLPLSPCPFQDYRPTLQLAAVLFGQDELPPGPWDEPCVWFGAEHRAASHAPSSLAEMPQAGLHGLRQETSRAILRCARFRSRPGHSDQLHLYLEHRGHPILLDPGSYLYNAPRPWDNSLASAAVHNGPVLAGVEPMRRAGRFLWLEWTEAEVLGRWKSASRRMQVMCAQHRAYRRLGIRARRSLVSFSGDLWMVCDELLGSGFQVGQVCWLLPDDPAPELTAHGLKHPGSSLTILLEPPRGRLVLFRTGERLGGQVLDLSCPVWGWFSPTYARKEPALSLVYQVQGQLPLRWVTWFCFAGADPAQVDIDWSPPGAGPVPFRRLEFASEVLTFPSD